MGAAQESREDILNRYTVEDINQLYATRQISKEVQQKALTDKALITVEGKLKDGYVNAAWTEMVKEMSHAWDNIKEAATHSVETDPSKGYPEAVYAGAKRELYYSMLASWGILQAGMAPLNAVAKTNGLEAERLALRSGASAGLASWIGFAADMGTNFLPIGGITRGVVKGIRAAAEGGILGMVERGAASRAAYDAAAAARTVTGKGGETLGYLNNEGQVMKTLAQALEADGVYGAKKVVAEAAEAAGRGTEVTAAIREAAPATTAAGEAINVSGKSIASGDFMTEAAEFTKRVNKEEVAGRLKALTEKLGIDIDSVSAAIGPWYRMSTKGAPLTDKQLYGYLKALESRSETLVDLARNAVKEGATDAERMAFGQYATDLFTAVSEKIGSRKEMTNMLAYWNPAAVAKGETQVAMDSLAKAMVQMGDMAAENVPKAVMKVQESMVRPISGGAGGAGSSPVWGRLQQILTNSLMPVSWTGTTLGNMITLGHQVVERFTTSPSGAVHMAKGIVAAMGDAATAAYESMRIGYTAGNHYFPTWTMLTAGTTAASDAFFKVVMQRAFLYDLAFQEAKSLGLSGSALGTHVINRVAAPTLDMISAATEQAIRGTYNADFTSFLGKWFQELAGSDTPASLYYVFVRSGVNLAKWTFHRTPGLQWFSSQLYKDILAGGDRMERAIGMLTLSNFAAFTYYEMAKDGLITGEGPSNPAMQREWRQTHEPNSIKVPGGWMPMSGLLEPWSMQMQTIANFVEVADQVDQMTLEKFAVVAALSFGRGIADRTAWRAIAQTVAAVNGRLTGQPVKVGEERVLGNPFYSVLSGGTLGTAVKRGLDPVQRDARSWVDLWRSRTPWASTEVPPMRDGYGDVYIPAVPAGSSWFGLVGSAMPKFRPDETNPVKLEGARLEAKLPFFGDQIGQGDYPAPDNIAGVRPGDRVPVALDKWQRDRWQQIYRNIVFGDHPENPGIQRDLLDDPDYKSMTKAAQRAEFQNWLGNAKRQATDALIMEDPQLKAQITENQAARDLQMTADPLERAQIRQDAQSEMLDYEQMAPEERDNLLKFGVLAPDKPVVRDGRTLYEPREPQTGLTIKRDIKSGEVTTE